jgi:hypothetical protein
MTSLIGALGSGFTSWWGRISQGDERQATWRDHYGFLRSYYLSNGLYDDLRNTFTALGLPMEALKPIRNPSYRVVEFYAAKLWPGPLPAALPIVTENGDTLIEAIEQLWEWSNWGSEKQAAARSFAMYGDMFLKVATRSVFDPFTETYKVNRVYMQNLEPQHVTDFDADERGYLTYARIDVPQTRRKENGKIEAYTLTEIWSKEKQEFKRWEHDKGLDADIERLQEPTEVRPFSYFQIDFVPIVWQPFRHIGDERGMAAITPAIDKIDEANRQATKLHQMLFRYNRPTWVAMANGMDSTGRPLPPPRLGGSDGSTITTSADSETDDLWRLPGMNTLAALVPDIDYAATLAILNAQMTEISRDLPEMVYAEIQEKEGLSGIALRYMMEAAIDRLEEARGNAEGALIRAQQMALTIGQNAGLFKGLGDYKAGALAHSFGQRQVLTLAERERAEIVKMYVEAGVPVVSATRRAEWTDEEREQLAEDKEEEQANAQEGLGAALLNAQAQFDRGGVQTSNRGVTVAQNGNGE